ncbi:hypothetical protein F2Q68_00044218 [Brassica cretica]|uniref:FHA domain-containing protein n=1 Tax=Brassica cretica TaxID=69181 RepID=A0A8S9LQW6_BRACR|nr:hypothetical protein F2Q68_00044218 [Brassica cretica]
MEKQQQVREKTIPVFTVLKNGAILKNIFVVNSRDLSSNGNDDAEVEEILLVGRHPDCDILLTHPSISRHHLQIRSLPSRQKLFLTDLSSVHGTWVADLKVEPDACVEVKEGDVIRIGGSTRIYRLHWIPLSRAYDVSPVTEQEEEEEENRLLEAENLEVALQSQADTSASAEDGDGHLDVTSGGSGSSVLSEDEDTYTTTTEILLPLFSSSVLSLPRDSVNTQKLQRNDEHFQTSSKWDLDLVVEAAAESPSRSCGLNKQQSGSYAEVLGFYELELADERDVRGDEEGLLLNVMSEMIESSVPVEEEAPYLAAKETSSLPVPRDYYIGTENTSSGSLSLAQIDGCFEAAGCQAFELASEAETMRPFQEVNGETAQHLPKAEIQGHVYNGEIEVSGQDIAVSPRSSPQGKQLIEMLTEDARGLLGSHYGNEVSIETDTENLHEIGNEVNHAGDQNKKQGANRESEKIYDDGSSTCHSEGLEQSDTDKEVPVPLTLAAETFEDTKPIEALPSYYTASQENQTEQLNAIRDDALSQMDSSRMGKAASVPLLEASGCFAFELATNVEIMCLRQEVSGDIGFVTEKAVEASAEQLIKAEIQSHGENEETEVLRQVIAESSNSFPQTEPTLTGDAIIGLLDSGVAIETGSENIHQKGNGETKISSSQAETFEDKLLSHYTGDRENQTPRTLAVRDDVLSELDISRSSSRRLSTSNIWSRRGKDASVLQVRTNKSEGKQKQIGKQAKAHLQRKALSGRSIYLTVDHGAYELEPEIFTPDKENLTPSSHMLKRLQDIGDIKDSKSSSKLSGKPSSLKIPSSFAIAALTEPEIFTPDKENLTPNSHMLRRLREVGEIKDTKSSSSKAMRKPFFDIHVEENLLAQQKPDVHCMSSNSKVKHEPVALKKKAERAPFQPLLEKSSSQSQSYTEAPSTASARNNISRGVRSSSNLSDGKNKMRWTIVLDTSSLLDKDSRKTLHLLQGLKGTHLLVPRTVIRELNETKRTRNVLFRRTVDMASSALDWIEECLVNTKWWIQLQSPLEETKATAPTPPVTPQSNGFAFPFSLQWNNYAPEIDSPTSEDEVLECALLYRNRNNIDEKLVLLSNDITLKIKAMAEGVICETALEFYESLKNPLSERFMWPESLPRGRTWSHADDVVLRERYDSRTCFPYRKKPTFNGGRRGESGAAKGLKLILLHNSQYGHIH